MSRVALFVLLAVVLLSGGCIMTVRGRVAIPPPVVYVPPLVYVPAPRVYIYPPPVLIYPYWWRHCHPRHRWHCHWYL